MHGLQVVCFTLGLVVSAYLIFQMRHQTFVPQMTFLGARGVGKTRLFCAFSSGVVPRTLPSLESTCFSGALPLTGTNAKLFDFHAEPSRWPKKARSVLYKALLNVLVVSDVHSLSYLRVLLAECPFARKGLTICCMRGTLENVGNASPNNKQYVDHNDVREFYKQLLRERNISEKHIYRDLENIRIVHAYIGDDGVDIAELAERVLRSM